MAKKYEVIIVGAGHNSLVCGARLVKEAGIKNILVLEKASLSQIDSVVGWTMAYSFLCLII